MQFLDLAVYIVLVALRITLSTCRYTMVFTFQPLFPNIPYLSLSFVNKESNAQFVSLRPCKTKQNYV